MLGDLTAVNVEELPPVLLKVVLMSPNLMLRR
jgi:hypothetical protein